MHLLFYKRAFKTNPCDLVLFNFGELRAPPQEGAPRLLRGFLYTEYYSFDMYDGGE